MQREHVRRGFSIHQKVVLEVDFSGSLWGYTEITLLPETRDLRTIHLHSRQCVIQSVTVASHPAEFAHHDPLLNLHTSDSNDVHTHLELKRKLYSALAEGDEGELSIAIPKEVVIRPSGNTHTGIASEAATPEPQTPGFAQPSAPIYEFSPVTVVINYSLRSPVDGIQFVLPSDTYPHRVPHVYTTPSSPDAARCWVPCLDNLWERCTWEFEFVVPRLLEQRDDVSEMDESEDLQDGEYPTVVVCSGDLIEQVAHPHSSGKSIFLFAQSSPSSVQHIAFAAGPFHVHPIPADLSSAEDASGTTQPLMHCFCLPGQESQLATSVSFMRSAMSFYSTEFGSYPFSSHKLVFVDELPTQRFDSTTFSIVSMDMLHTDDVIDQVYETRLALSHALACQWVGINIHPKAWSDIWLVNGLGLYITGLYIRKLLGNNEYRFRLKKDMERVLELDNGSMPPICQPQLLDPPDPNIVAFINLKAPLVLHILDRRLGKSGTSLGLSRVLPKVFLSAISGEMPNNALSTHSFLRTCRKVSGIDPRSFAEQWIYGSGCPTFGFSATFNRKKMAVEISMRQEAPAYKVHENNEVGKLMFKPVPFFEGQMTIRIHEADGTPYEHVLDIRSPYKRYEVPFNTKYKRVRRNTKRYLARQAAAQAAAEGDAEAAAAMDMVDMGFGLEIWEKEKERENWKVADWTEEDEQNMSGQTYEWIRIDADFEWLASIAFDQKDYMWVSQLQRDRDVVAQYEAIQVLAKQPNAIISSQFTKTVLVTNYFFRIRCEAAQALVTCAVARLDWLGLFHLFKLFLRYCYEPEDQNQDLFTHTYVPRPNDFSDFAEYFVRKSLLKALSKVRFENGKTPPIVRQFLIDQLRYNDNTSNHHSDALYICTIISTLATASVSAVPPERGEFVSTEGRPVLDNQDVTLLKEAVVEINRYRSMDRLIPSVHNVVTIATIEFYLLLGIASLIPLDARIFFPLTREGIYTQVRVAAFDALFFTKWYTPKIMQYVLAVMSHDSSRTIRRHVARSACQSLAFLVTMGEMRTSKETESLMVEEDGGVPDKAKESKKSDMELMIKALRKDREIGKNEALRQFLMPIALAPDADHEVRWCLLKLADLAIRGAEEVPPKVTIHLPPTPVTETPPSLPSVKLKTGSISIKANGGSVKSPLTSFQIPPKLKLPLNGAHTDVSVRTPDLITPLTAGRRNDNFPVPKVPPKKVPPPLQTKKGGIEKRPKNTNAKVIPNGMSIMDLRGCQSMLKKLQAHKSASLFLQPVDPVRDRAPQYFEIIKKPMDLSTIGAKLDHKQYKDRFAFEEDFRLMIQNAKTYNMAGSYVHSEAIALEVYFDKEWARVNKTLEAHKPVSVLAPPKPQPVPSRQSTPSGKIPPITVRRVTETRTPVPPATPTPAPSRPTIKLKMGSLKLETQSTPIPTPGTSANGIRPKPKKRESKLSEVIMAEDPYDDGTADLLAEVVAIEQQKESHKSSGDKVRERDREKEKEKEREREQEREKEKEKEKEKERVREKERQDREAVMEQEKIKINVPKLVIGKRKKTNVDDKTDDDEILALATPAKKERSAASSPVPTPVPASVTETVTEKPPARSTHVPITKNGVMAKEKAGKDKGDKVKEREKDKEKEKGSVEPVSTPKPSAKGKEKEVAASASKPKKSTPPTTSPVNKKKCKDILTALMRVPDARIFLQPVDPIRDGCPTYYDEIKHPMDFGTMSNKLAQNQYNTMEEFAADMGLIFSNCRQFNPPTTYPVNCADHLESLFKREWGKVMEKKMVWNEKRSLQGIMNKLVQDPVSWVFREPVDPVLLGIPTYFDVIPRKNARDLRTIRTKLDADRYDSVEGFEAELDLMVDNAILFNGAESEVGQMAATIRNKYRDLLAPLKSGTTTKRKGDSATPQPMKKLKLR